MSTFRRVREEGGGLVTLHSVITTQCPERRMCAGHSAPPPSPSPHPRSPEAPHAPRSPALRTPASSCVPGLCAPRLWVCVLTSSRFSRFLSEQRSFISGCQLEVPPLTDVYNQVGEGKVEGQKEGQEYPQILWKHFRTERNGDSKHQRKFCDGGGCGGGTMTHV